MPEVVVACPLFGGGREAEVHLQFGDVLEFPLSSLQLYIMAELAALGLASNIVQFIDFGLTLFHEGKELYDSDEGGSAQRLELETVTEDLNDIAQELQQGALPANKGDAALRKLGADCEKLAKELLGILDKLKVKDGQNRKWASFKQAVKGMVKDGKIRNIEARLQKYREQLGERLLYILRFVFQQSHWKYEFGLTCNQ